jgi:hypothetical protein
MQNGAAPADCTTLAAVDIWMDGRQMHKNGCRFPQFGPQRRFAQHPVRPDGATAGGAVGER